MSNIGEEIARTCAGLPLAAIFLGNLMRFKRKESDWLAIRDNDVFNTPENPNKIILVLKLSYDNLSSDLKKCFSYCSLFPKDYLINRETLIQLWTVEGFLHPSTRGNQNSLEDVGNDYFLSLLSSSFFQDVIKDDLGDIIYFKMHDLVHDLSLSVSGSNQVMILKLSEMGKDFSQIRRVQLIMEKEVQKTDILNNAVKLRTIFFQGGSFYPRALSNKRLRVVNRLEAKNLDTICSSLKFKHMRYLDLRFSNLVDVHSKSIHQLYNLQTLNLRNSKNVQNILNGIGSLINLQHLNLFSSDAKVLPDSITRLTNLHTLNLNRCKDISSLPTNIESLQNLSFLDISHTQISELPDSITLICSLKRLETTWCGNLRALSRNLGALKQLRSLNLECTRVRELPESLTSNLCKSRMVKLGAECEFPEDISNWVDLRQLTKGGITYGVRMPIGIEKLTCLEELLPYIVSKEEGNESTSSSSIHQLADLNSLRKLRIEYLENVKGGKVEAQRAKLKDKQNIQHLDLQWYEEEEDDEEDQELAAAATATMVLEGLQPHPNLEIMYIRGFPGLKLPEWMGSSYCLPNLVELTFEDCNSCINLVSLGQFPCLKVLQIKGMESLKSLGKGFYYQQEEEEGNSGTAATTTLFPSLTKFTIENAENLEEWCLTDNSFPCLERLEIFGCGNLAYVPDLRLWSSSLRCLKISKCNKLKGSIPYDLKKEIIPHLS
ncbi:putative disease resistance protein RGA3 [Papaver somniferum]|uniref:putative disease resistance protein RGA3 n=1 Tax=Papaver somniferum TaxID=3469 RepID=UPI000E705836|nr:putative disease resistance protein RGA3 [Papaver somniferum]